MSLAAAAIVSLCALTQVNLARADSSDQEKARYSSVILQAADAANAGAEVSERAHDYPSAVRQIEQFLDEHGGTPASLVTYPVLVTISAAHLEAAYDRIQLPKHLREYNNPTRYNENVAKINVHLNIIPGLLVEAKDLLVSSELPADVQAQFRCDALRQLAAGVAMRGVVNSDAHDIDSALNAYSLLKPCGFDDASTVRQLKFLKSNMGHSLLSPDTIVMTAAVLVSMAPNGRLIRMGLQIAYSYIKHREAIFAPSR